MSKRPLMVLILLVLISIAAWVAWYLYQTSVLETFHEIPYQIGTNDSYSAEASETLERALE